MDHTKMPMSEVLTPDEKLVADFIKTRTKKVLDDIQRLSKEQNADISEWAESFAYLARTYGRDSDETFKWFKYYFREGMIPANVALPLVVQVYLDSSVDGGFVNTFAKAFKQEPEDVRNQRIEDMKQELHRFQMWHGTAIMTRKRLSSCCLRIRADSGRWHLRKLFRHPNTVRTLKKQLPYRLMLLLLRESKETDR